VTFRFSPGSSLEVLSIKFELICASRNMALASKQHEMRFRDERGYNAESYKSTMRGVYSSVVSRTFSMRKTQAAIPLNEVEYGFASKQVLELIGGKIYLIHQKINSTPHRCAERPLPPVPARPPASLG
jgi:hypothetical protein